MLNKFKFATLVVPAGIIGIHSIDAAMAHTVKTDGTVGATFHLEPNHNPRAGETSLVWFALTRQGGEIIPLDQCDCQLQVYQTDTTAEPILTPQLEAVAAEQYQGIPGANVIFPEAGIYILELSGEPQSGNQFKPFQFQYDVTVTPGTNRANPLANSENTTTVTETSSPSEAVPSRAIPSGTLSLIIFGLVVAIASGVFLLRRK